MDQVTLRVVYQVEGGGEFNVTIEGDNGQKRACYRGGRSAENVQMIRYNFKSNAAFFPHPPKVTIIQYIFSLRFL